MYHQHRMLLLRIFLFYLTIREVEVMVELIRNIERYFRRGKAVQIGQTLKMVFF